MSHPAPRWGATLPRRTTGVTTSARKASSSVDLRPLYAPSRARLLAHDLYGRKLNARAAQQTALSCSVAPLGARLPAGSTRLPGSVSGPRSPDRRSPWARPFPPRSPPRANPLCSIASRVLRPRPTPHSRACSSFGCCLHEPVRHACRTGMRPPRFQRKDVFTCMGSTTARGSSSASHLRGEDVAFPETELGRHLEIGPVSQLNTQPVITPVNASRLASRPETRASLRAGAIGYILPREGLAPPILSPTCLAHSALGQARRSRRCRPPSAHTSTADMVRRSDALRQLLLRSRRISIRLHPEEVGQKRL